LKTTCEFDILETAMTKLIPILLLPIFSLLLPSCASGGSRRGGPEDKVLEVTPWNRVLEAPLNPDEPDGPGLRIEMSLMWVDGPKMQAEFLNSFLYSPEGPEAYVLGIAAGIREAGGDADFSHSETVGILSLDSGGGLVVRRDITTKRGNESESRTMYFMFDLDGTRRVQIDDLLDDFQGDTVRSIVYGQLRRQGGLRANGRLSSVGFLSDEPELSFNFRVMGSGLVMRWNPGEVTPHSFGGIDLLIPWSYLDSVMRNSGAKLVSSVFGIERF